MVIKTKKISRGKPIELHCILSSDRSEFSDEKLSPALTFVGFVY
jgi:hypothetical protein